MDNTPEKFMQHALNLARSGEGLTRPNPPVGAVLVQDGKVIAEGYHLEAGGPHAEVNCLQQVSDVPEEAVLYVTLEPCSTEGKTPPCTEMILSKGIRRVAVGCLDPNPAHAGNGIEILRRSGVDVTVGICAQDAEKLIAPFSKRILKGLPYVTLKLGVTLDGCIADADGVSQWITGPEAREEVQNLRRRADAVMVGAGTVRADNPSLLPRPSNGRNPWRIIIGSDIPDTSVVLNDEAADRTLVRNGDLHHLLKEVADLGIMHVLCEGGGELAGSLIRGGLVDEFVIFTAPAFLGGSGVPMAGKEGWSLKEMPRLKFNYVELCGEDLCIHAVPLKEE